MTQTKAAGETLRLALPLAQDGDEDQDVVDGFVQQRDGQREGEPKYMYTDIQGIRVRVPLPAPVTEKTAW